MAKKIILITIIIVIIIILLITAILLINKKSIEESDFESVVYNDVEAVTNHSTFYRVDDCLRKYYLYIYKNDLEAVKLLNNSYIENPKQINPNFKSEKIYAIDKVDNITAYVYGVIRQRDIQDDYYLIVNLDYKNNTFSIVNSSKEEYENATKNQINDKYKENIYIQKNKYNSINELSVKDFDILNLYFEDYKFKALYKPEEAFNLIDIEYRKEKFDNNIEKYKSYIQKNIDRFQDANIVKHNIIKNGQNIECIAIDNYNNYYKIIETGINEYTVSLDNYTVEDKELVKKYNAMSEKDKVISNVDKVIKLINEKDYETLYKYLNSEFKNNYFKTFESFESYLKQKFFDNNIVGELTIKKQGSDYIITVPYVDRISVAAEEGEITLVIRLKQGIDFELGINMK